MDMTTFDYWMNIGCWSMLIPFVSYYGYSVIKERIDNGRWLSPDFEEEAAKWGNH